MRIRAIVGALVAGLLLLAGGSASFAEGGNDYDRFPNVTPYFGQPAYQPRRARPRADPYAARGYRSVYPQSYQGYPPSGAYYQGGRPIYPGEPYYGGADVRRPSYPDDRGLRRREIRRHLRTAPPPTRQAEVKPKVEPSTVVAVFGDSLADLVSDGLDDAYADAPEIEVLDKAKADSGLARSDHYDWPKAVQDYLATNPHITAAVVMLGSNDRQAIRVGDASYDPLSDRWREIYRDRVDAVLRAFAEKHVPVVWVGAPPMKNEKLSTDLIAINEIFRERVQKAGGVYVDVWPGFVDDENHYAASGPDVEGQTVRLRTSDGVHFTAAGARKAAHFVETELKRIFDQKKAGAAIAALPDGPNASAKENSIDQIINASIPALPEPKGALPIKEKPLAGPVVPLTRAEVSPSGALLTGRPKLDGEAAYSVDRFLREGIPPQPEPGRADDFKWPKS